jgi:chromosome segregation ATPase
LTDMAEDRKQLLAESMRLQKELSKVLTENEELFKAKGGNLYMKVGASSKQVHVMKERIKSLEAEKAAVQKDMAKLKADSKVTRLAELEVEKGTYLHEVRRLQQENRKQQEELQDIHARTESQAANAEEGDMNYNKMFDMYMERGRQLDEAKRKMRDMQVKTQEAEEDKRQAETERNKLTQQLQRVRQTSAKAEGGGVQRGVPRDWKDKEEALQKEIRELKQVLCFWVV